MSLTSRLSFGLERNTALIFWGMFFLAAAFGSSDRYKTLYIESLGARPALVGIVLAIAEGMRLLALIASGPLSDRVAPSVLMNVRWLAVGMALVFLAATHWWMLFPAFVLQAAGNLAWPTTSRVIGETGDQNSRGRRFLLIYSIAPSSAYLGAPLLGAVVAAQFGLRAVFVLLTVFIIVSSFFFSKVQPAPYDGRSPGGGYFSVLKHRPTLMVCILSMCSMFVLFLGLTLAPNYLHNERGISFGLIGAFGSLVAVGSIAAGIVLTRSSRFGKTLNGVFATMIFVPPTFILLIASGSATVVGLAYLLIGVGVVSQQAFLGPLGEVTSSRLQTRAFATIEVSNSIGIMTGGLVAGVLYAADPAMPLWAALIGSGVVITATLFVWRTLGRTTAHTPAAEAARIDNSAPVAKSTPVDNSASQEPQPAHLLSSVDDVSESQ